MIKNTLVRTFYCSSVSLAIASGAFAQSEASVDAPSTDPSDGVEEPAEGVVDSEAEIAGSGEEESALDAAESAETEGPAGAEPEVDDSQEPVAEVVDDVSPRDSGVEVPGEEEVDPPSKPEPVASAVPFSFSTSMFSRLEVRENYDSLGVSRGRFQEGDQTVYRARIGIRSTPVALGEELSGLVQFTPQASGAHGQNGTIAENNVGIYEGYFRFQGGENYFDAGRFMMNYGDALIIGNLGWHQTARSFDGLRFHHALGAGYIDAFVTQATLAGGPGAEGHPASPQPLFGGDSYFYGLYAGLGPLISESLSLDAYLLLANSSTERDVVDPDPTVPTVSFAGATQGTFGVRAKQKIGMLDYRAEAGVQFGARAAVDSAQKGSAYQLDGEVGVSPASRLRLALGAALASGDDPSTEEFEGWAQLYPTAHKWFGLMDVAGGRSNLISGVLKVQAGLTESLTGKLDAHVLGRPRNGGLGRTGSDKLAGYEIDAQLVQKIGKPGTVRCLYGLFIPNGDHYAQDSLAHFVEIQAGLSF